MTTLTLEISLMNVMTAYFLLWNLFPEITCNPEEM
jgi:hypothetical protein